ncbi:TPA: DUF86 domain-containing protein [Candidatus Sumerlaeota bacterium]|jgi:uncharacterized protein with HEPN domain|nr:DUF86 domain-containing protein [Candidatus Sumerlaeota bacterium]
MRRESNDASHIWDMIQAARGIHASVIRSSSEEFVRDEDFRLAIERRFEVLGEAARRVSDALREQHPEIPWRGIIAQRNMLIHQYDDVDDQLLWTVATKQIPELLSLLEAIKFGFQPPENIP